MPPPGAEESRELDYQAIETPPLHATGFIDRICRRNLVHDSLAFLWIGLL